MQKDQPLETQYLQILQKIKPKLNRKEFCELHNISQAKLSRILSGKIQPSFELFWYICMHCGYNVQLLLY